MLLPWASRIEEADRRLRPRLDEALFARLLALVPDAWLVPEPGPATPAGKRAGYLDFLGRRLRSQAFAEEAARAGGELV